MSGKKTYGKQVTIGAGLVLLAIAYLGSSIIWGVFAFELKIHEEKIWVPKKREVYQSSYSLIQLKDTALRIKKEEFLRKVAEIDKPVVMIFSQSTPQKITSQNDLPVEYLLQTESGMWIMISGERISKESALNTERVTWTAKFIENNGTIEFTPTRSLSTMMAGVVVALFGAIPALILWIMFFRKIREDKVGYPGTVEIM